MAVTSTRRVRISFTGESLTSLYNFVAASNLVAPDVIELKTLASGANTITLPTGGSTPTGATIIPPAGNLQTLTLKGVTGDTGILMHKTDPFSISFDTVPPASFVLTAGGTITGLRIVWT